MKLLSNEQIEFIKQRLETGGKKMTQSIEPQVNWSQDQMIEVTLNEPDDFLKVRETLTRIGVGFLGKRRSFISRVISFTNKVSTTSSTSKSCLLLTVSTPT